jgi:4-hydroxybenzoate polyprenyltransferase
VHVLPDTEHPRLARTGGLRPYILLARFDRPVGWWLLFWPCAWGLALAGGAFERWDLLLWMLLGAIAMRGAGCVYNDIVDRDLDAQVERTRGRPLASGAVSVKAAWAWLLVLCAVGLVVLVQLPLLAALIALGSLVFVAAYPFMKRITWWPQAWLGIVFSWGALVGWAAHAREIAPPMLLLYAGTIAWVIGYDTVYALQDREDDALVGIRSSALRLGRNVRGGVVLFYLAALVLWSAAIWWIRPEPLAFVALVPAAIHFVWQVTTLRPDDADDALVKFRSNRFTGLLVFLACLTVGTGAA